MDIALGRRSRDGFTALSSAVPRVSKHAVAAFGWVIGGLVLAVLAHRYSARDSLERWKKDNRPTLSAWKAIAANHGLQEFRNPKEAHPALRSLPSQAERPGHVWWSAEGPWIAIYEGDDDSLATPVLLGVPGLKARGLKPGNWAFLGMGWDALQDWDRQMTSRPKPKAIITAKKVAVRYDPREIVY